MAALEQAKRSEHGVSSMRGLKLSSLELTKMADAGVSLALAAGNGHLVKTFGLKFAVPRLALSNLHALNLPESFLAVVRPEILKENSKIISLNLSVSKRQLTMAFDKTYLLSGVDICSLRFGKGFIGTRWEVDSLNASSSSNARNIPGFLPLGSSDFERTREAEHMEEEMDGWDVDGDDHPEAWLLWVAKPCIG